MNHGLKLIDVWTVASRASISGDFLSTAHITPNSRKPGLVGDDLRVSCMSISEVVGNKSMKKKKKL